MTSTAHETLDNAGEWPALAGSLRMPAASANPAPAESRSRQPTTGTVVHPGAASGARRWPAEQFAAVAAALAADGHEVIVTAGPGEEALAETVVTAGRLNDATIHQLNNPSYVQLFSLIATARLVICGDTGVAHVASAYRTPSVVLFGPVSPARWGPPADPRHQVIWHGDGRGDPHREQPDPALLEITVEEVLAASVTAQTATLVKRV